MVLDMGGCGQFNEMAVTMDGALLMDARTVAVDGGVATVVDATIVDDGAVDESMSNNDRLRLKVCMD